MCANYKIKKVFASIILLVGILHSGSNAFGSFNFSNRQFFGTYIGIDLGLINQFEASPFAGYRITPWWEAGAGGKYQYYYDKRLGNVFKAHIYGPMVFTSIIPVRNFNDLLPFKFLEAGLFLHAEMDIFYLPVSHFDEKNNYPDQKRFFRPTWVTGIGLRRDTGQNRALNIMFIFDLSSHTRKIYANPALRFGFTF